MSLMGGVDPGVFIAFVAMTTAMSLAPGPAVMLTTGLGLALGGRLALMAVAGILVANTIWLSAAGLGLATLAHEFKLLFEILRYVGAAYILWLAYQALTHPPHVRFTAVDAPRKRGLFARAFLLQMSNPKALVYITVLFPPFISSAHPAAPQVFVLGATALLAEAVCLAGYAYLAGALTTRIENPRFAKGFAVVSAVLLASAAMLTLFA